MLILTKSWFDVSSLFFVLFFSRVCVFLLFHVATHRCCRRRRRRRSFEADGDCDDDESWRRAAAVGSQTSG